MTRLDPPPWYRQRPDFVTEEMLHPESRIERMLGDRPEVTGIAVDHPKTRLREDALSVERRSDGLVWVAVSVPDTPALQQKGIPYTFGRLTEAAARPTITLSALLNEKAEISEPDLERTQLRELVILSYEEFTEMIRGQSDHDLPDLELFKTANELLCRRYGHDPDAVTSVFSITLFMRFAREVAQHYETGTSSKKATANEGYQGITAPLRSSAGRESLERIVRSGILTRTPYQHLRVARSDRS